jgi:hypothetical protein
MFCVQLLMGRGESLILGNKDALLHPMAINDTRRGFTLGCLSHLVVKKNGPTKPKSKWKSNRRRPVGDGMTGATANHPGLFFFFRRR